jgi:hypothetical protein
MAMTLAPAIVLLAAVAGGFSQQAASPSLQSRPTAPPDERPVVVLQNHAKSLMPEDASGFYPFGDRGGTLGEGIEIDQQFGDVTGYLIAKATAVAEKGTLVGYFFSRIEGGEGDLSFTTKPVHGIWYSFTGKLIQGPGISRAQEGLYLLDGTLIAHDDALKTTQRQTINLKLAAVHYGAGVR